MRFVLIFAAAASLTAAADNAPRRGFTDTPMLPDGKWRVHDAERPAPRDARPVRGVFTPAPSDAIVLFDGRDLSKWVAWDEGRLTTPAWPVRNGYFQVKPGTGSLVTKEKFGDIQLHVEFATPSPAKGEDQMRGNSGVLLMGRYELQILDNWRNPTYADGYVGAVYGQHPPLVNACLPPGEWQSFDIVFEAPRFDGDRVVKRAKWTVFHNGVLIQDGVESIGAVAYREVGKYTPHAAEEVIALQDHDLPVRFRNIWVRRLDPARNK
jgi:hypothetical protein